MAGLNYSNETPSFAQAMGNVYNSYSIHIQRTLSREFNFPQDLYSDWLKYGEFGQTEVLYIVVLALGFTFLRYMFAFIVFGPIGRYFDLLPVNQQKFPEAAWKWLYCTFIWSLNYYFLIHTGRYDFFQKPNHIFRDWEPLVPVPADIYMIYMIQAGFYVHSMYAVFYMDQWRRDSPVTIFHHILTLSLLVFSYAARYHTIGALLLLFHDLSDVSLELTKCNVYFKDRGGKYYKAHDTAATIGFLAFTIIWFVGRLYLFPVKVLNAASHGSMLYEAQRGYPDGLPFFTFFNVMLLAQLCLNIYWFMFILNFLYKVATGQLKEVDDVREEEVLDRIRQNNLARKQNGTTVVSQQNGSSQNGTALQTNGVKTNGVQTNGVQNNGVKKRLRAPASAAEME